MKEMKGVAPVVAAVVIIVAIIAATAAYILTRPPEEAPETTTVRVWFQMSPTEEAYVRELIYEEFDNLYPNIRIELTNPPDVLTKITAAIPAGEGPDVFGWAHDWTGKLAKAEFIVPIDDFVTPDLESKFQSPAVSACKYEGKTWALPWAAETVTLVYNKGMLSDAGFEPPEDTDELKTIMQYFRDKGDYGIVVPWDPYHVSGFVHAFDGYYFNDSTKKVGLTDPKTIDGVHFLYEEIKPYMPAEKMWELIWGAFTDELAPLMVTGPWMISEMRNAGIDPGLTPLPTVVGVGDPKPYMGVRLVWMTSNVRDKEAAFTFMEWWTTSMRATLTRAEKSAYIPVLPEALEEESITTNEILAGFAQQVACATPMPASPEMTMVWGPAYDALDAAWVGTKTIEEAFQDAQEEAEANIAEMD